MVGAERGGRGLVGRAALVAAAVRQVEHGTRLLTLTGRRGVGKTALALTVVERLPRRAAVVALDDAVDHGEHLARTCAALGLDGRSEKAALARLRELERVVVLDGCAALDAAARLARTLLDSAPGLTLVATAPALLGVDGEQQLAVPTLELPPVGEVDPAALAATPAVALFVRAAEDLAPTVLLSDDDLVRVAELCRSLDGLPRAVVHAAALLRLMRPAAMLEEMSRLGAWDLVGLSVADEVARSIASLEDGVRPVLVALAVMTDGARADAVAEVAGDIAERDVLQALALLARRQLVVADRVHARYALTASATEHVRGELRDDPRWRDAVGRHAAHYAEQARALARRGPVSRSALLDHRNRLAALARLRAAGDRRAALRLAVDCMTGFEQRGELDVGRRLLTDVLSETPQSTDGACIEAHLWLARLDAEHADVEHTTSARAHVETALRLARQRGDVPVRLEVLNAVCESQAVLEDGVRSCEDAVAEALELTTAPELQPGRALFLCWHAANLHRRGRLHDAAATVAAAMRIARRCGDRRLVVISSVVHWELPPGARHDDLGVASLAELLEMAEEQGDVRTEGWIRSVAVGTSIEAGADRDAASQCLGLLRLAQRTRQRQLGRHALVGAVRLSRRQHDARLAATLAGALARHGQLAVRQLPPRGVADVEQAVAQARAALGDDAFQPAQREGTRLDVWSALRLAEQPLDDLAGAAVLPTAAAVVPTQGRPPSADDAAPSALTPREQEVLAVLAVGSTNKEVAEVLGVRPKTVAHHCAAIYAKLGVRGRTEAVTAALRLGLVGAPTPVVWPLAQRAAPSTA